MSIFSKSCDFWEDTVYSSNKKRTDVFNHAYMLELCLVAPHCIIFSSSLEECKIMQ